MNDVNPSIVFVLYLRRRGHAEVPPISVLSAPYARVFDHTQHPGGGSGFIASTASSNPIWVPSRGIAMRVFSSSLDSIKSIEESVTTSPHDWSDHVRLDHGFTLVEQSAPVGKVSVFMRGVVLSVFGVYTREYDALIITDVYDLDGVLSYALGRSPQRPFVMRLAESSLPIQFATRRLCSRWSRWHTDAGSAQSFIILQEKLRVLDTGPI